jgi:ribosomal protein S18 acetylase RimI-like enzyme
MTNPQPTVRRASVADAEIFTAITHAAFSKWIPLIGRPPQPMSVNYANELGAHQGWLLLDPAGQPVGALLLMTRPDHLLIYSIAVLPEHQGRGYGRRLLALAEHEAQRQGHDLIRLYTNERFVENIDLYQRVGYHITCTEHILNSVAVHMAKALH